MANDTGASSTTTAAAATGAGEMASSNAPNLDGILLLEAPFAKVPFDELRRQQKTQQRLIERELQFATTNFSELAKSLSSSPSSSSSSSSSGSAAAAAAAALEVEKSLDAVLGRLKGLKRKLAPISEAATTSLRMAQARTDHLQQLHSIRDAESTEFGEWSKTRLDRMIVDYMLRRGYRSAAQELAESRNMTELVDLQLFEEVARIEDSLCPPGWEDEGGEGGGRDGGSRPSCGLALAWCSENKAVLRKLRTPLEFNLRMQEFVELARVRTAESVREAIGYARRHLLPLVTSAASSGSGSSSSSSHAAAKPVAVASSTTTTTSAVDKEAEYDRLAAEAMRREVSRAMGLLACGPGSWAYADLYSRKRWSMLRDSFRACALQIHSLPPQPILHIALSAGLSSLKLPQCYSSSTAQPPDAERGVSTTTTTSTRNTDCPICDSTGLGRLAHEVPWSHHQNSTLVCSHSGRLMDHNDPPLALANGRVYAQSTVLELVSAASSGGQAAQQTVTCPRTAEVCRVDEIRKVYIS